jgi:hypothetical protein
MFDDKQSAGRITSTVRRNQGGSAKVFLGRPREQAFNRGGLPVGEPVIFVVPWPVKFEYLRAAHENR